MDCKKCGATNTEGSRFCKQCGALLSPPPPPPPPLPKAGNVGVTSPRMPPPPSSGGNATSLTPPPPAPVSLVGSAVPPLTPGNSEKQGADQTRAGVSGRIDAGDNVIPDGVRGWSWGAFLLNWIWAIGNRTWIGLLVIAPSFLIGFLYGFSQSSGMGSITKSHVAILSVFGNLLTFGLCVLLGLKGREWAWKKKKWDSIEHFNIVQRRWSYWGVVIVTGICVIGIITAIAIPTYQDYKNKAKAMSIIGSLKNAETWIVANKGGANDGSPLSEADLAGIRKVVSDNKHVDSIDAFAYRTYADLVLRASIDGQEVVIYGVSIDQMASWKCVSTGSATKYFEKSCEMGSAPQRPVIPKPNPKIGLWDKSLYETLMNGCVQQEATRGESNAQRLCSCLLSKESLVVPQEAVQSGTRSPEVTAMIQQAANECAAAILSEQTATRQPEPPAINESKQSAFEKKIEQRFKQADVNGHGYLTKAEAMAEFPRVGRHFDRFDKNHDGRLSLNEITEALKDLKESR